MSIPSFWARLRAEAPALLRLAAPLIAAQITFVAWGVLDTLMAGRLGERELAAIAVGANIWVQIFIFFMGVCIACSPIIAQRVGAGQAPAQMGSFVRQALAVSVLMGLLWIVLLRLIAWPAIEMLNLQPDTAELAHQYLLAESWSGILFCLSFTLRNCAEGMGLTRIVLWSGIAGLIGKVVFNHIFVKQFGVAGFGWGTVAASAVLLVAYLAQYLSVRRLRELQIFQRAPLQLNAEVLEIFRLGIPIGMILFAEVAFFGCTALLMARFGDAMVAAHQVAINFASITFMVPMGIGLATAVRVGHAAGAGAMSEAELRGKAGMCLGLLFALFSATLMAVLPAPIAGFYTSAPDVAAAAAGFLRLAAIFQLFDCLQATASGALRGIKDTRLPMLITVTAYWLIGMPASYALAIVWGYGPNALWWGFTLGLGAAALGLGLRFFSKAARLVPAA